MSHFPPGIRRHGDALLGSQGLRTAADWCLRRPFLSAATMSHPIEKEGKVSWFCQQSGRHPTPEFDAAHAGTLMPARVMCSNGVSRAERLGGSAGTHVTNTFCAESPLVLQVLHADILNENIRNTQYAVRGELYLKVRFFG